MSIKMKFKKLSASFAVILCMSFGISVELNAHDTDIYLNSGGGLKTEPLVMFALDYRSNLSATVCNTNDPATGLNVCQDLINEGYLAVAPTSFFNLIRAVLKKVLDPLSGFKVGFMMNHDDGAGCVGPAAGSCSNGGYILHGFQSVTSGTDNPNIWDTTGEDANKLALFDKLDRIPKPLGAISHAYQGKELYFELFRYLTGAGIFNAHNGYKDYGTTNVKNISANKDARADGTEADGDTTKAWLSYDTTIENGALYKGPLNTTNGGANCAGIFMINMMFAVSNQEDQSDTFITKTKADGGMDPIDLTGLNNNFDTVIRWMNDVDLADGTYPGSSNLDGKQNVTSYFLVDPAQVNNTTNGYAEAGGTTRALELSSDPRELVEQISSILRQILSTSTTFVAPSVAVNVYNRAQVESDIFIAMFQADAAGKPRWNGNVKKFQIGELNGVLGILDAHDPPQDAVNPNDGRIKAEALSFWTNSNELIDPVDGIDEFLAGSDGRFVNRGGCGSRLPGYKKDCSPAAGAKGPSCTNLGSPGLTNPAGDTTDIGPRKVFTESATGSGALRDLNADGTTATELLPYFKGASAAGICSPPKANGTPTEAWDTACGLIRFARGINDKGENRRWMMGDPLHSRPLPVNYGGGTLNVATGLKENPDIRIFMGSNDGMMHMIRNRTPGATGVEDGVEGWGFMPLESMKNVKRLKANNVSTPHLYGVDGSPVAFVYDANGNGDIETGDKVHLYFGMRRGGRNYYGLDVTDPDNPSQLWSISNNTAGFSELGESWSTPRVGYMLFGGSNTPKAVLIFAGGYDANKDTHGTGVSPDHSPTTGGNDSMGRGIFIIDAATGALVWKATYGASTGSQGVSHYTHAEMLDSIPSDVTAVDTDGNGLLDRIYVGDTGGKVWRVDMLSNDQTNWSAAVLFSGGRHFNAAAAEDRRFFYEPDYVQSRDGDGSFDAVIIGAGDRADPLDVDVSSYFYVIKDRAIHTGTISGTTVLDSDLEPVTCTLDAAGCATPPSPKLVNGWKMQLKCPWQLGGDCGEKALSSALTIAGKVYFTTYQPTNAVGSLCDPSEGSGYLYIVSLQDGTPKEDLDLSQAGLESYTKLSSGGIPSGNVSIGGPMIRSDLKIVEPKDDNGFRTFWYERIFDY